MKVLNLPNDLQNRIRNYYGTVRYGTALLMERKYFYFNLSKRLFLLYTFHHLCHCTGYIPRILLASTKGYRSCRCVQRALGSASFRNCVILALYSRTKGKSMQGSWRLHHLVLNSNFYRMIPILVGSILSRLSAPFRRRNSEGSFVKNLFAWRLHHCQRAIWKRNVFHSKWWLYGGWWMHHTSFCADHRSCSL